MSFCIQSEVGYKVLSLSRPEAANAYNQAVLDTLEHCLEGLEQQPPPVLIVESTGEKAFCAGADLKEMQKLSPQDALELRSQKLFTRLSRLPSIVLAAIQGSAVAGGFELALACDLRVAGPKARFWLPETSLGILPSAGGTTRLARLVGISRAKEVIVGGRVLEAEAALLWGVVHRVVADPRAEARSWAAELLKRDFLAQRLAKELLDSSESESSLAEERGMEALLYGRKRVS
jgi:enoyl-CoA hydratase